MSPMGKVLEDAVTHPPPTPDLEPQEILLVSLQKLKAAANFPKVTGLPGHCERQSW